MFILFLYRSEVLEQNRINLLEQRRSEPTISAEVEETCQMRQEIEVLKAAHVDANNRMRRNNLLFLGLNDCDKESRKESEKKVLEFCATQLNLELNSTDIERAHRLGKFNDSKKRPIIIKLVNFKTKEIILACGRKLKETQFAIREDFASVTRFARSKLLKFIRPQKCAFKLQLDKLHVGSKCYFYDPASDTVMESTNNRIELSSESTPVVLADATANSATQNLIDAGN